MKSLKNFLEKKKMDKVFKKAGRGQTLSSPDSPTPASQAASTSGSSKYKAPTPTEDRRQLASQLADAHEKRLNPNGETLTYAQKKIREQARRELEEEQRQEAEASGAKPEPDARKDDRDGVMDFEHSSAISKIRYTCDLFDGVAGTKAEMIEAVEEFLMNHSKEEPVEAGIIMLGTLNLPDRIEPAIALLVKIIKNIIKEPDVLKYRRIKKSGKQFQNTLNGIKGVDEFLTGLGFLEDEELKEDNTVEQYLCYPEPTPEQLKQLADAVTSLEHGSNSVKLHLYREPKVFKIDPKKPIPRPEIPVEFYAVGQADLKKEQARLTQEAQRQLTLRTKQMRDADAQLRRYHYKYTLIRVRFPDDHILEGVFSTYESIGSLREYVISKLNVNAGPFILSDTIRADRKFDQDQESFGDLGLVPAALLHFDWHPETLAIFAENRASPTYLNEHCLKSAVDLV